ncbi:MAG: isocitrate/isopropylmalate dehydrogenase family protein [Candidatus Latescibacterota bacterium]|nr:isocitrate/isopropylmalate dehydrogenase family protein [Candidatus Latescibacterota bacterium]MED5414060.1 isocitrate/isopropylmalate dehydrogenase family protein [Candidatus Latescibacterota bacterium]MEE3263499.1 isocitrate/isopropylmalate dehydrogenase family protein [Candidatus Latescibacterota bacterium]MEE3338722.1 isocitrate/isopropylmalate dehydrogenase family protein [Candidatus Latescibacterota bacterium]|tara:strand:+ start:288 stop:1367 length:1080 start_codon:yes stop_codon:yes gene_type:complete
MSSYQIAVLKGDGIGPDVVDEALRVLDAAGGPVLSFSEHPSGADCYKETGDPLPEASVEACRQADAVLIGAMGLPDVRWPDGTEMRPQVDLRFLLDLYAGLRPIYLYTADHCPLKGYGPGDIDFVLLRENVEGLFASMNGGIQLRGETAVDSMVITRTGTERIVRYAFELAEQRSGARSGNPPGRVTCVDKANIFRSMAFFRQIFDEVGAGHPAITADHAYVDAMALYLVRQPQTYDVLVAENMFGDILSDLAAGLVGGLGMAPSGDIGEDAAVFQPVHGTAPDIAGQGVANPVGTILSAAMMWRWLGHRHDDEEALAAAARIEDAVRLVLADKKAATPDIGGTMKTHELGQAIAAACN